MRARQSPSSPEYREAMSKRSVRQGAPQPIRFYADTRLLEATNDPSTCYTAGDTVTSYQNPSNTYAPLHLECHKTHPLRISAA